MHRNWKTITELFFLNLLFKGLTIYKSKKKYQLLNPILTSYTLLRLKLHKNVFLWCGQSMASSYSNQKTICFPLKNSFVSFVYWKPIWAICWGLVHFLSSSFLLYLYFSLDCLKNQTSIFFFLNLYLKYVYRKSRVFFYIEKKKKWWSGSYNEYKDIFTIFKLGKKLYLLS